MILRLLISILTAFVGQYDVLLILCVISIYLLLIANRQLIVIRGDDWLDDDPWL